LSSQNLHEALVLVAAHVAGISARQVPVQRRGVELREHVDLVDVAVDAVADRNINQPVVGTQGHGGLRPFLRQGVQSASGSSTEDNSEHTLQKPNAQSAQRNNAEE